jgi:coenzyme F420-0:L-glutamate ligase/coenzyme F420-1:gamma-L-glutamate ligase
MNSTPGTPEFWSHLDRLVADCRVVIDRPRGSRHPRYPALVYPLDYGYLKGTTAVDGGGIDVWMGSLAPKTLDSVVLTADLIKHDAEIKLLLGCTEAEKQVILDFLNDGSMQAMLVRRENDYLSFIKERRSVRRFLPRPVPAVTLERLLEAATWAPSSHHCQPWRLAVLTNPEIKIHLAEAMADELRRALTADGLAPEEVETQAFRSRRRIIEAPAAVLLCLDITQGDQFPDEARQQAETLMGVQSVAMAGQNLLLAAHAEGLGGVWVCAPLFAPQAVRRVLDLPGEWRPQGLLLVGYPAQIPPPRLRRTLAEITRYY